MYAAILYSAAAYAAVGAPSAPSAVVGAPTGRTTGLLALTDNTGGSALHQWQLRELPSGAWFDAIGSANPSGAGVISFSATNLKPGTGYAIRARSKSAGSFSVYVEGADWATNVRASPTSAMARYTVSGTAIGGTPAALDNKDPAEILALGFDFSAMCGSLALSAPVVGISVASGTDPAASDMLSDAAVVVGAKVLHWVQGGVDGVTYHVTAQVDVADGSRYKLGGLLPVTPA